jgi:CBS domain-containing protein
VPVTASLIPSDDYLMPSLRHATVADAMHPGIVSCPADATLSDVACLMATHHVHCIAVTGISRDDGGERLVWGLISDLDVMRAGIRVGADESAGALALEPIVSVDPATPLSEAGELMLKHGVRHVVVVDPATQRPTGVLSTIDLIGVLAWGEA